MASLVAYWRSRDVGCLLVAGILVLSIVMCALLRGIWVLALGIGVSAVILFLGSGRTWGSHGSISH